MLLFHIWTPTLSFASCVSFAHGIYFCPLYCFHLLHCSQPIVTGTSVLAIKYVDGVMLCADTLGSYGSMAMFKSFQRLHKVNETTMIGASGEFSDFQYIQKTLQNLT